MLHAPGLDLTLACAFGSIYDRGHTQQGKMDWKKQHTWSRQKNAIKSHCNFYILAKIEVFVSLLLSCVAMFIQKSQSPPVLFACH
jgi:hypothetical protein